MSGAIRLLVLVMCLAACVMATVACDDGTPGAHPTSSPTPSAHGDTTVTATATAAPSPTATAAPQASGPRVLLTYAIDMTDTGSRTFPTREVLQYDLGAGRVISSFQFGGVDEYPVGTVLAGDLLITATEAHVWTQDLDGGHQRLIATAAAGSHFAGIAASPDSRTLAITQDGPPYGAEGALWFVGLPSGNRTALITQDTAAAAGFLGAFYEVAWRSDGAGVLVTAATGKEGPGPPPAFMFPDGTVRPQHKDGPLWFGPGLEHAGVAIEPALCLTGGAKGIEILAADSHAVTSSVFAAPGQLLSAEEWAPDGSGVLYAIKGDQECAAEKPLPTLGYAFLPVVGPPVPVPDPAALRASWYGPRLLTVQCNPSVTASAWRTLDGQQVAFCGGVQPTGDVVMFVGGQKVASARANDFIHLVAFLP